MERGPSDLTSFSGTLVELCRSVSFSYSYESKVLGSRFPYSIVTTSSVPIDKNFRFLFSRNIVSIGLTVTITNISKWKGG